MKLLFNADTFSFVTTLTTTAMILNYVCPFAMFSSPAADHLHLNRLRQYDPFLSMNAVE